MCLAPFCRAYGDFSKIFAAFGKLTSRGSLAVREPRPGATCGLGDLAEGAKESSGACASNAKRGKKAGREVLETSLRFVQNALYLL